MRTMNPRLQRYNLERIVANSKFSTEMTDIHSMMDSTLHFRENADNIRRQMGISTRNLGMEEHNRSQVEHERDSQRRNKERPYQSWRGIEMDMRLAAMRPGRRISAQGNRYYEYRNNRLDRGRGGL